MLLKVLLIPFISFSVIEKDLDIKLLTDQIQSKLDNLVKEIQYPGQICR